MNISWSRKQWFVFSGFTLYFVMFLVPKVAPGFAGTSIAFILAISLVLVVPLLVFLALWGIAALVISKMRKQPIGLRSKKAGWAGLVGLCLFAAVLVLGNVLPAPLPGGSYDKEFDRAVWLDPASANYTKGDITPRQKMVADIVEKLPGLGREELETMLGPPLDTQYFENNKRDLIYMTGPQRDVFFSLDSEWLLIWLDEKGMYKRYAIVND